jgi:hypothetical protein
MTTQRAQQTEDPGALPPVGRRMSAGVRQGLAPEGPGYPAADSVQAQIAEALAALADRVSRLDAQARVSRSDRESALAKAREFVGEVIVGPIQAGELIYAELEVARFLVGER